MTQPPTKKAARSDLDGSTVALLIECGLISPALSKIRLDPEAYHDARTVAPGWDVYVLEGEWMQWMHEYDVEPPRNPTKAFIGFCRKHAEKNGMP